MNPDNKMLYKFVGINKATYAIENLSRNQLCYNHYAAFNDPFECWCIIQNGFPDPQINPERFLSVIGTWGFRPEQKEDALEYYHDYAKSLEDGEINVQHWIDSARICCFCLEATNLLMWAHYADGMRGYCIELHQPEILKSAKGPLRLIPVQYRDSPPVVDTAIYAVAEDQVWYHDMALAESAGYRKAGITNRAASAQEEKDYRGALNDAQKMLDELYRNMLATKPVDWQYEKEARIIFHAHHDSMEPHVLPYSRNAVKSLILGDRMAPQDREAVIEAVKQATLDVPIRQARRERNSFRVLIE